MMLRLCSHFMIMATVSKRGSSDDESLEDCDQDDLTREFEAAAIHLRTLTDKADASTLLYLYARYKQATEGACNVPKPGLFDFRGKQKWDAWKALGNLDRATSMREYVRKIKELDPEWTVESGGGAKAGSSAKSTGGFGVGVSRPVMEESDGRDEGVGGPEWLDAVKEGDLEMLKAYASSSPKILQETDDTGMTAMHWAADRGHQDILEWLITEAKLNVNAQDASGQTPLHYAYACGHQRVISTLLASGADESIIDQDGNKPADLGD